jgi:hypothetical protein
MSKSLKLTIVAATVIALILTIFLGPIYWINTKQLSNTENMLLSQLQMILSIIVTWVITHLYSQQQQQNALSQAEEAHRTNLRSYARQAAEKVNNLSDQLNNLTDYLRIELEETYTRDNPRDALLAVTERMSSAIQIVSTLKSVNDTSLSDWQGVIGDLLDEKREEKEEQEKEIREFIEKTMPLFEEKIVANGNNENDDRVIELKASVDSLKKELRTLIAHKASTSISIGSIGGTREDIVSRCPVCNAIVSYRQGKKTQQIRGVSCVACKTQLVSMFDPEKGFQLEVRKPVPEEIKCPGCNHLFTVEIDILASPGIPFICPSCSAEVTVRRRANKLRIRLTNPPVGVTTTSKSTEELLDLVKKELPPQPWPQNTHKDVAAKLQISNNAVREAIQSLINQGSCFPQINGVVYYPDKKQNSKADIPDISN